MNPKRIRLDAQIAGEKYYQGKPCRNGHDGMRYTSNGQCCQCHVKNPLIKINRESSSAARQEAIATGAKTYIGGVCGAGHEPAVRYTVNAVCVECTKQRNHRYYAADPERAARYGKEWREKNYAYYLSYARAKYQPKPRKTKDLAAKAEELRQRREYFAAKRAAQSCPP